MIHRTFHQDNESKADRINANQLEPIGAAERSLLQRIRAFKLDLPGHSFPFSHRLAWNYRWSQIYTLRAIEEYKKFAFMTIISTQQVSPSATVDRVWHSHLLCTKFYWEDFCGEVLKQPLHHYPSIGSPADGDQYYSQYEQTLAIYRRYFGEPPADIWHPPLRRSEAVSFQWVDRSQYWLIPRLSRLLPLNKASGAFYRSIWKW